jgi:PAT family beta-lactamase induction signal transducer AmpG
MSQYGWRIGSVSAGALALVLAARVGWEVAYAACALFALPAMITGLILGEPKRHREPTVRKGIGEAFAAVIGPFSEFLPPQGRAARSALHPAAQDRRHARTDGAAAAAGRHGLYQ